MRSLNELFDELVNLPNFSSGTGASEQAIEAISISCQLTIPDDYREFLRRFGYASWLGKWIFGVFEQASVAHVLHRGRDYDCIRQTAEAVACWRHFGRPFPQHSIAISDDGAGGFILLTGSEHRAAVHYYHLGDSESPVQEWSSFALYLTTAIADTREVMES